MIRDRSAELTMKPAISDRGPTRRNVQLRSIK
jgi:hypothetical protein